MIWTAVCSDQFPVPIEPVGPMKTILVARFELSSVLTYNSVGERIRVLRAMDEGLSLFQYIIHLFMVDNS